MLLYSLTTLPCNASAQDSVQFSWAILHDTPEGRRALDTSRPIELGNGATLQIYIEQQPRTFIYLYLLDSADNLTFLFPERADFYSTPPIGGTFWVPSEKEHFELVPPAGQERMYLLASASRLIDLEELTAKFIDRPDDPERKGAIIQELKKIRRSHSALARNTEMSVPVAGTVLTRGEQTATFDATKVSATDFYSKILRINHE